MCRRECLSGDKCEHARYCKSSSAKAKAHYREWRNKREAGRDEIRKRISRAPIGG